MKYFLLLTALVLQARVYEKVFGGSGDGHNTAPFHTLCSIYHLALKLTTEQFPESPNTRNEVKAAIEEVKRLFALTSSDDFFEQGPPPEKGSEETPEERKKRIEVWGDWKKGWMDEEAELGGKKSKAYPRPPEGTARKAAHVQIEHIRERLNKLENEVITVDRNILNGKKEAKRLALEAIFGKQQTVATTASFSASYADGCGNGMNGHADGPGKSLVNDIVCLCIGTGGNGYGKTACGPQRIGAALNNVQYNSAQGGLDTWKALESKCHHPGVEAQTGVAMLAGALAAFRAGIGVHHGVTGTGGLEWILGGPDIQTGGCDGANSAGKNCVNYKQQLNTKGFEGIPWYANLIKLIAKLEEVEGEQAKILPLLHRVESLKELAQRAFLGAAMTPPSQIATPAKEGEQVTPITSTEMNQKAITQGGQKSRQSNVVFYIFIGFIL